MSEILRCDVCGKVERKYLAYWRTWFKLESLDDAISPGESWDICSLNCLKELVQKEIARRPLGHGSEKVTGLPAEYELKKP